MRDLTKWPRLLVTGESVIEKQANEVLIRTCNLGYLGGNDREWNAIVGEIMNVAVGRNWPADSAIANDQEKRMAWFREQWDATAKRSVELRILDLDYLVNSRISSSSIGGPHGWCDWDGTIGCDTYNVGKWPSHDELTDEWVAIAEAFPFLSLTAQVITDEGEGEVAGQWALKDGVVTVEPEPETQARLTMPRALTDEDFARRMFLPGGERGVSPERLREAVAQLTR